MNRFWRATIGTWIILLLLLAGFSAGYLYRVHIEAAGQEFPLLLQAYKILAEHGLHELPSPSTMEYGMIRGMVEAYKDPYTIFVEPVQHELESNNLQGNFGGIGARLSRDAAGYILLYPIPDGPAAKAGLMDGDRLLGVDEVVVTVESGLDGVEAAIRGPVGERVKIVYGRSPGYEPQTVTIRRAEIPLPSVTWRLDADEPRLGIIDVNVVAASSPAEIERAVEDLQRRGALAFALDLRDNFGGLLTAGIDITRLFLGDGIILEQQYRDQGIESYNVEHPGPFVDLPLVILVNQHTASAAEIVAGALKESGRAKIVGVPTFGKDSIQLVFDLKDGSSLHVTAAKWWVPGLTPPVGEGGVQPDMRLESPTDPDDPDVAVMEAIKILFSKDSP